MIKRKKEPKNYFDTSKLKECSESLRNAENETTIEAEDVFNGLKSVETQVRLVDNIFDKMSDSVVINEFDGVILFVNRACEKLTGWSFNEIVRKNVEILRPSDSSISKF